MQSPGEFLSPVAAIPLNIIWRSLHEFAQRESDLPHRFQSPLVLYTQTHRPAATRIAYCLFMLIIYMSICFFKIFILIFVSSLKAMSNLNFYDYGKLLFVFYPIKSES